MRILFNKNADIHFSKEKISLCNIFVTASYKSEAHTKYFYTILEKHMKNYLLSFGSILLGSALILSSCQKEDSTGGKISYQVKPANFTASVGSTVSTSGLLVNVNSNSSLTWTSGNLNITEIDFEAENNNAEIEYELKDLYNINLFTLSPVLGNITIPDGTYDEVELKLKLKKSITSDLPLTLKGSYTNSVGTKMPVEFYFNEEFEMEVEAEDLVVSGTTDYLALINVQLNKFLTNVTSADLNDAVKTNGTIVISATSNANLYNKLKANMNVFGDCDFED